MKTSMKILLLSLAAVAAIAWVIAGARYAYGQEGTGMRRGWYQTQGVNTQQTTPMIGEAGNGKPSTYEHEATNGQRFLIVVVNMKQGTSVAIHELR